MNKPHHLTLKKRAAEWQIDDEGYITGNDARKDLIEKWYPEYVEAYTRVAPVKEAPAKEAPIDMQTMQMQMMMQMMEGMKAMSETMKKVADSVSWPAEPDLSTKDPNMVMGYVKEYQIIVVKHVDSEWEKEREKLPDRFGSEKEAREFADNNKYIRDYRISYIDKAVQKKPS